MDGVRGRAKVYERLESRWTRQMEQQVVVLGEIRKIDEREGGSVLCKSSACQTRVEGDRLCCLNLGGMKND